MPTPQRHQPVGVIDRLLADPHRFGFFQAVRLLERWFRQQDQAGSAEVMAKRLSFRSSLSLAFPPSEIAALRVLQDDASASGAVRQVEITPAFMGLLGAGGALPVVYTELLAQREHAHRDDAGRAFIDIFLHRAVALFYQAWRKHRLPVQFEADRRQSFLPLILSVAGLGSPGLRQRLRAGEGGVSDDALAFFAGALQQRPMSAASLERLLAQYFGAPVCVEQFVGRWYLLPKNNQMELGVANGQLGSDTLLGERVYQRDLRARITLGPLTRTQFDRFLPGGPGALALSEWLKLAAGTVLDHEVRLTLHRDEVGCMRLTADEQAARLGFNSFLVTQPAAEHRSDAGYDLPAPH